MVFLKRFSARDLIFYLLAILVMVFTFNTVQQMNEPDDPTYNEIRLLFEQEKVKYFSVEDNVLTLTLRGEGEDTSTLKYHLADFNVFYNDLHELIDSQRQAGIIQDYDYPAGWAEPWWFVYVPYLVILLGFGILMYTMYPVSYTHLDVYKRQGLGDLLGRHSAEEAPALAGLGGDLHHQSLQLLGGGLGLRLLGGLLGLACLLLLLHGVDIVRRGRDGQLPGQKEVAGVSVGDLHHLALLALALDILL